MVEVFLPAIVALLGGLLPLVERRIRKWLGREKEETYSEKLSRLTASLEKSSREVDELLKELASVAKARTGVVASLETQLNELTQHEQELKKRVQDLQATPIPVAEHFAALIASGERRSAVRDYVLFGLGVVVSTAISIALRVLGMA